MTEGVRRRGVEQAFVRACTLDVNVLKPGNVSLASPGHGMTAAQFLASANAAAPALCAAGAPIGKRILDSVVATLAVAHCNTNLGILLLCAPLGAALESFATGPPSTAQLRQALQRRLLALTVADSQDAFRAIARASPGGLGSSDREDVHREPTVDLRTAMEVASGRDLIARQYANGYADLFEVGVAAWQTACESAWGGGGRPVPADDSADILEGRFPGDRQGTQRCRRHVMQWVFLEFLASFPDSHIVRKHGPAAASDVMRQAQDWRERVRMDAPAAQAGLAGWDADLKAAGLNPGTSADLAVATAFVAEVLFSPLEHDHRKAV